ncbi:hypothetical protein GW17_00044600 [Ensete ventricosum]|nr:hypothetical protein GW17_00044600 [Ensete ventricosum]
MWVILSLPCLTSHQPPIVRGTVRWSVAASALTRRLSLAVRGQGALFSRASLARQLCCTARCQGGQLASRRTARGYLEVGSGVRQEVGWLERHRLMATGDGQGASMGHVLANGDRRMYLGYNWIDDGREMRFGHDWTDDGREMRLGHDWANNGREMHLGHDWTDDGREIRLGHDWIDDGREMRLGHDWTDGGREVHLGHDWTDDDREVSLEHDWTDDG